MADRPIEVFAFWDGEAGVYVATSDHVPGLVAEACTVEALIEKLRDLVPELLELNGALPSGDGVAHEIPLVLRSERASTVLIPA
jgi:predicted RNase H-like HicB family nuclease